MHILIIEDDVSAADYLRQGLTETGHVVDVPTMAKPACRWRWPANSTCWW